MTSPFEQRYGGSKRSSRHGAFEADGLDYRVFTVRGGLISHKAELTDAVEEMTGAVGYGAIEYTLQGAAR